MDGPNSPDFERLRLLMAGACARPLVHDANNYLGAAMAYAELAQMEPGVSAKTTRQLGEVVGAVTRCSRLMNLYAQLVRPIRHTQEFSVTELVREAVDLRLYVFRVRGVQVDVDLAEDLPQVFGYAAAFQYALLAVLLDIEQGMLSDGQERRVRVAVAPMGDHAAVRFTLQRDTGTPMIDDAHLPDAVTGVSELDLESAKAAIELQNGHFAHESPDSYLLTVPFTNSLDALPKTH